MTACSPAYKPLDSELQLAIFILAVAGGIVHMASGGWTLINRMTKGHGKSLSGDNSVLVDCLFLSGILIVHIHVAILALESTPALCRVQSVMLVAGATLINASLCFSAVKAWRVLTIRLREGCQLQYGALHVCVVQACALAVAAALLVGSSEPDEAFDGGGGCRKMPAAFGVPLFGLQLGMVALGMYAARRAVAAQTLMNDHLLLALQASLVGLLLLPYVDTLAPATESVPAHAALVLVCAGGAMASLLLTATKRVGGGERLSVSAFRLVMSSRLTTLDEKLDYHFTAT